MSEKCPKCGSWLLEKSGKYGKFLACPKYPDCKHTQKIAYTPKEVKSAVKKDWSSFRPSTYQQAIVDHFVNHKDNILVGATAGSGKTTLIEWIVTKIQPNKKVLLLAFNTKIANELKERIEGIEIRTFHSFGLNIINNNQPKKATIDDSKVFNYLKKSHLDLNASKEEKSEFYKLAGYTVKLVSMVQSFAIKDPDNEILADLAIQLDLDLNGSAGQVYMWTLDALQYTRKINYIISFADMIDFPWYNNLKIQPYDYILIDESQDMNLAQMDIVKRHIHENSKVVFVGDEKQAIYGFRGADNRSIAKIKSEFNTVNFSLPVTYRNSQMVVNFVNEKLPHIIHLAHENATIGSVNDISQNAFNTAVKVGDMVLCRNNAPLITPAWELIKRGVKVVIVGRDIGTDLANLIKRFDTGNIDTTLDALQLHKDTKVGKLNAAGKYTEAQLFGDKIESAINILIESETAEKAINFISEVFSDQKEGIAFSTIHKAKGLEAKNVYILSPELLTNGSPNEDYTNQEFNIAFVAYTRAIENLYLVS